MVEIKERVQSKMETMQKSNREKSMAKIKELTEQHKKDGKHNKQPKQSKADKSMFDDLEGEDSDGGDKAQKEFKNKGKVHESKQKNKRQ
jgi:hypothetical protein